MLKIMKGFLADERGQASTEYAVIIGVIALALIAVLAGFRDELKNVFNRAKGELTTIENAAAE
jgi:pilus assembly protein Flp/PilA